MAVGRCEGAEDKVTREPGDKASKEWAAFCRRSRREAIVYSLRREQKAE